MREIRWFLVHGGMAACLWFGLVHGVPGAKNVGLFMVWLAVVVSVFALSDKVIEACAKDPERRRLVPVWLDVSFDLAVVGLLVWHGYTFTGVCYLLHVFLLAAWRDNVKKRRESMRAAAAEGAGE